VLAWLSVCSKVQTCIWPSGFYCHSLFLGARDSEWQIGFTFLVPAHLGGPGQRAVKRVCVCVCVRVCVRVCVCVTRRTVVKYAAVGLIYCTFSVHNLQLE